MKYLCLGYYDPAKFDTLSEAEQEAIARECRPHDEALRGSGRLLSVASLAHRTAASLRPVDGTTSVTDGPFAEAKEIVGSFFIIEAEDLDEAIRIASLHPAAKWGAHLGFAVEVRPIEFYDEAPAGAPESDLPSDLAKPARRALAGAGYVRLGQLAGVGEAELLRLHGMGPGALDRIRRALAARGLSLADS